MDIKIPKNHNDFLKLIDKIDTELKKRNVPIYGRPIEAAREFAKKLKIEIKLGPNCQAIPNRYDGDSLAGHIYEWYQKRYGERLKINFSPGSAAIIIRGDVWKINTPRVFGVVRLTSDRVLDKYPAIKKATFGPNPPIYNILRSIEGFPSDLALTLNNSELAHILSFAKYLLDTLHIIEYLRGKKLPLISEAKADYDSAVSYIFMLPPQYGLSKWGSLQFIEKLLKCFLSIKGVGLLKTHELKKLSVLAQENGLPILSKSSIEKVQCSAGVRYGENVFTLEEAVDAHHASLIICNVIVVEIMKLVSEKAKNITK